MSREAHPALPEFDYIKPKTLAETSSFLAEHAGEARPLLGGTDIFVRMRDGAWKDKFLVDIKGLEGIDEITFDAKKGLTIGAAVCMNRVSSFDAVREHYPLLVEACDSVASYQLRNRATVVGNICNASPAGDTIGACLLYNGSLNIHGSNGARQEPLHTFFKGPGQSSLKPGDIATSLQLPLPPKGFVGKYLKLNRNNRGDLAIVGVTAVAYPNKDVPSGHTVQLALASVAPTPLVVTEVEEFFLSNDLNDETIAQAAEIAMDSCKPIDDVRGTARYRKMMVRNLAKQALTAVRDALKPGTLIEAEQSTKYESEMTIHTITVKVNGEKEIVEVPAHWTLLQMLRYRMGLTGTKNGCAGGECGACTVMLNGVPVNSCMVLGVECDGAEILTVEGLSYDGHLDPVQQAIIEAGGVQCGFCTPGVLISARALLDRTPSPSDEEIQEALVGNLCRCTGYVRIIEGIKQAAKVHHP